VRDCVQLAPLLVLMGASSVGTADNLAITHLQGTVYRIREAGSPSVTFVASVGEDGILLADTGYLEYAPELKRRLAVLSQGRPVRFVTNSHHDDDHIGANGFFSPGALNISSDELLEAMKTPSVFLAGVTEDFWPDITYSDSVSLFFNGEEIRLFSNPGGHSSSDATVFFTGSNVLYTGDLTYGIDFPQIGGYLSGNAARYSEFMKRAIEGVPDDALVACTHGTSDTHTVAQIRDLIRSIDESIVAIRAELAKGKSAAEIVDELLLRKWRRHVSERSRGLRWVQDIAGYEENPIAAPRLSFVDPLYEALVNGGVDAAVAEFHRIRNEEPDRYSVNYAALILLADFLRTQHQQYDDAIRLLELNANEFPRAWRAWREIGRAYAGRGERELATAALEKALDLKPGDAQIQRMLDELRGSVGGPGPG